MKKSRQAENEIIRATVISAAISEQHAEPFRIFGRGHEPRVTLDPSLSAILRGLELPRVHINGYGAKYYYPCRVFTTAIRLLRQKLSRSPIILTDLVAHRIREEE